MRTEKNIFDKALHCSMEKEDKPKYGLPKRDDAPRLDYSDFLSNAKTGKPSFDLYIEFLSREMQTFDEIDPYEKDSLKVITDKADAFLRRHAGISYEDFLRQSKPETFTEDDYGNLPAGKNLKRRLFEHKARLYLSALEEYEQKGYNIFELLPEIQKSKIPYIKKEINEPTFKEIMKVLNRND